MLRHPPVPLNLFVQPDFHCHSVKCQMGSPERRVRFLVYLKNVSCWFDFILETVDTFLVFRFPVPPPLSLVGFWLKKPGPLSPRVACALDQAAYTLRVPVSTFLYPLFLGG